MSDEWEQCEYSGLAKAFCDHCKNGIPSRVESVYADAIETDYERIGGKFTAQYHGTCTIERDHSIKRGDLVSRVQRSDNPMIPVPGVACASCTKMLSHA